MQFKTCHLAKLPRNYRARLGLLRFRDYSSGMLWILEQYDLYQKYKANDLIYAQVFLCFVDNKIVGWACLFREKGFKNPDLYVYVQRAYRRRKIARKLVTRAIAWHRCKRYKPRNQRIVYHPHDQVAHLFYKKVKENYSVMIAWNTRD